MSECPANLKANPLLSRWFRLDERSLMGVRSGKVELGQGATTALAMIAATELGLELDQIDILAADTAHGPDEGYTAGSFSVEHGGSAMRWAAAQLRELAAQAAATVLGATADQLVVEAGQFRRQGHNEGVTYWQLRDRINLGVSALDLPAPVLRGGTIDDGHTRRPDLVGKLSGAGFIQDMTWPDLLHGRVLRPDHPQDRLLSCDDAAAKALAGVVAVVRDGHFAGVVAQSDEIALAAIALLRRSAQWQRQAELPLDDGLNGWMDQASPVSTCFLDEAQPDKALPIRHAARYSRPFIAHASIGPACAVAQWHDGQLQVWSHSQGIYPLRRQLARTFGLDAEHVQVTHAHGAGCYGHNGADDVALDAALLARAVKAPVMCLWTRADELSWSPFGAAMRMELSAGLDESGQIVAWNHAVWSPTHLARPGFGDGVNLLAAGDLAQPHARPPLADAPRPQGGGDRNAVPLYDVGARKITHHLLPQGPLRSSALRALGAHGNVFAIESFMDELAALAGRDPLEYRLAHLSEPRGRAVVEAVAKAAQWNPDDQGGEGHGRGLGFARYKNLGAYCAVVAEVEVAETVRLVKVTAAVDAGEVIHRDGLLNQIEGGIIQAASWTLKEAAGWTQDGFKTRSWADYPILNFSEIPAIEIVLLAHEGAASLGGGECAAGPVAAAIGNAIAHALGVRVRDMPLTPERITQAIHA
jgi:hypothetical protein